MSLIRVLRTASATLTRVFYADELQADLASVPAVTVTRPDGTTVTSGTAVHGSGDGAYTYTLPGGPTGPSSATWQLDTQTATWSGVFDGTTITLTDTVEVVGGFFFSLAEARASDASLADPAKYPTAVLAAARTEVEQACEEMCFRAFVPRFRRARLNGSGGDTLIVPDPDLRVLRSAAITWVQGGDLASLTGEALSRIQPTAEGLLVRPAGLPWPAGRGTALVEYEYGLDQPPLELKRAALVHLRAVLTASRGSIPDRVSSYTTSDGSSSSTFRLTLPGRRTTGIPAVDAVYLRYAAPPAGFA